LKEKLNLNLQKYHLVLSELIDALKQPSSLQQIELIATLVDKAEGVLTDGVVRTHFGYQLRDLCDCRTRLDECRVILS
jgi:hypothetical protein